MGECGLLVEILVCCHDIAAFRLRLDDGCTEDATGKVATIGDEVYVGVETALYLNQRLLDLSQMLMGECLIDAQVVITPGEVGGSTGLLACTCRTGNGIDGHIFLEQSHLGSGQQGYLYGCSEAAWVGNMLCLLNGGLVDFGQTIDIIVVALDAEILCQVDNLDACRYAMFFEELFALAVTEAEENDVDLIKGHFVSKLEVGVANESFMYVADQIAGITL